MTTAGKITAEDRQWASDFITKHFTDEYLPQLHSNIPQCSPNWRSLFHGLWGSDLNSKDYDKALWLRREIALSQALKAAYARFLGRDLEDEKEILMRLLREQGVDEKLIEKIRTEP